MQYVVIFVTCSSRKEARAIADNLVGSKLAACVNIIGNMNSLYMWEGEIQDDQEVVLIAKTREDRVEELTEKVKSIHSYDCPCIVSLPILNGNRAFLDWIRESIK